MKNHNFSMIQALGQVNNEKVKKLSCLLKTSLKKKLLNWPKIVKVLKSLPNVSSVYIKYAVGIIAII